MKAFALGRRAKWKDYVDLYFLLENHFTIADICRQGELLFGSLFSEKMFRQQLSFHKDIDYSEPIEFIGQPVPENEIREFLIARAIDILEPDETTYLTMNPANEKHLLKGMAEEPSIRFSPDEFAKTVRLTKAKSRPRT